MLWKSIYHRRIAQIADYLSTLVCLYGAYLFSEELYTLNPFLFPPKLELRNSYILLYIAIGFIYVGLFDIQRAYNFQRFTSLFREYLIVINVSLIGTLITIGLTFFLGLRDIHRTIFISYFIVCIIVFTIEKTIIFYLAFLVRKKGKNRKNIILVGTGKRTSDFINIVNSNYHLGLNIIGILTGDNNRLGKDIHGIKILDNYSNIEYILKTINPDEIIITLSTNNIINIRNILDVCENEGVQVRLKTDFFGKLTRRTVVENILNMDIISFYSIRQSEIESIIKRIMDIFGSIIAIILFSPLMLLAAIGILITSGRPILYSFIGYGRDKKPIKVIKFRTMIKNANILRTELRKYNEMIGPTFKIKNDPRITKFGKWLRVTSIDETPQLFSVLIGEMSLVGPRQAMYDELESYKSWHRRRLSVKPGLTCLWQINGRNNIKNFDDWVKLDLEYIDNWSLFLDIKILLRTIPVLLLGKGE